MNRLQTHSVSRSRYLLVGLFIAIIGLFAAIATHHVRAADMSSSGERLITLHDRGIEKGILTSASTLRQAFEQEGIVVDKNDLVEPGLDETLVANNYQVNIYRARPVIILDGMSKQKVLTPYQTSKQIIEHAGLELHDEDKTTVGQISDVVSHGAGLEVSIDRATPFTLVLYGKSTQAFTQGKTVAEMMKLKDIKLTADDTLSVSADTQINAGMTVQIWRNGVQTVTEEQAIDFSVEKIQDVNREKEYTEVKTPGVKGKKIVTYEVTMKDGVEQARREIQTVIGQEPSKQIEIVGAKNNYSGSLTEWLSALRGCEAGGLYNRNSGNGYYGAYQFSQATWNSTTRAMGRNDLVGILPSSASPSDQDEMIIANTNRSKGGLATQNPGCYKKLGLSQFPPS